MMEIGKIKEIIRNYNFPYSEDDIKKMSEIIAKISNIISKQRNIDNLTNSDATFLMEKGFIDFSNYNLINGCINYAKNGLSLWDNVKEQINKLLEKIAINLREKADEWKYINTCNKLLLQDSTRLENLTELETNSLVNVIINSSVTDKEKEELLIYISLNLFSKTK